MLFSIEICPVTANESTVFASKGTDIIVPVYLADITIETVLWTHSGCLGDGKLT